MYKYCKNCNRGDVHAQNLCHECYRLVYKIERIKGGKLIPKEIEWFLDKPESFNSKKILNNYCAQIKRRLSLINEAYVFSTISEHDLELQINSTLRLLKVKDLGKFNDEISLSLKDDGRSYVHQIFARIKLQKKFKANLDEVYKAGEI